MRRFVVVLVMLGSGAAAASEGWELGVRGWWGLPVNETFGPRAEVQVSGEWNPWAGLRLRPGLRVTSPIAIHGNALGYDEQESIGSFIQVSPCFFLLWGWDLGPLRISVGPGFSHHVRFTSTPASSQGMEIVRGSPQFGHLQRLDFTDHAGIEAMAEVGYAVTENLRLSLGAGFSHASVRLLVEPQENSDITIGFWRYMDLFSVQGGLSWKFGG